MLKLNPEQGRLEAVPATELRRENILERYDLQNAIVHSWELFKNEIGIPSAFLIGEEINPHPSTNNSIDILAFDPDDSSLVVVELKRDKNKLQLLQALSYAGMARFPSKLASEVYRLCCQIWLAYTWLDIPSGTSIP